MRPVCGGVGRRGRGGALWRLGVSVGVIAIVVCVDVAVLLADLCPAGGRGVFSAGRVRRHPPLLGVPGAALKQARVGRGRRFHGGGLEPGVLRRRLRCVFGLVLQRGRMQGLEQRGRVQPGVARRRGGARGGRGGRQGPKPAQARGGLARVAEVLRGGPAGGPARRGGTRDGHARRCKMVVRVVAERVVSGCLQGEGFVEAVPREVPIEGGSEVEPVCGHALLGRQVPAAVGTRAGGRVSVLLAHGHGLAAEEAALGQGAHVLLREVPLRVAASW